MRNAVRTFIQGVGICLLATALWVPGVPAQTATAPQSWPSKPLRLVVPFPAGGAVDLLARLITPRLGESLGQPVVLDYRAGAGGNVGADLVAKSAADGYTMLLTANGHAIGPALYKKLPFSAERDFAPVTQVVATTFLLAGKPSGPIQSLRELLVAARARPGSINYGSTGIGSGPHLTLELLKVVAGVSMEHVPYKGDAPLINALMANEIDVAAIPPATGMQYLPSGKLRALALTGAQRSQAMPDVPTPAEAGLAGFEFTSWQGLFMPANTPRDIVQRVQRDTARALAQPELRERLRALGMEIVGSTPEEFEARFKADIAKFTRLVRDARIPQQD
jgi:tripartite-type tricarboxylate transporter receptor subunit TctC